MTNRILVWALVSGAVVGALIASAAPSWLTAFAHLLSAAGVGLLWPRATAGDRAGAWRAAVIAGALPVSGGLAAWWVARGQDAAGRPELIVELEPAQLAPELAWPERQDAEALSPWSLAEQVADGGMETKLGAAQALADLDDPAAVRALRSLLRHPDGHARLVASLKLQALEEDFARSLHSARRAHSAVPGPAAALVVARAASRYAASGLPTGAAARALWQEAAQSATAACEGAGAAEAHVLAARAHLALHEPQLALSLAEEALRLDPTNWQAAYMRCEALWDMRALDRLPHAAHALARLAPAESAAAEAARHWTGSQAA